MNSVRIFTAEDTLQEVDKVVLRKGDDFHIKVSRRVHMGAPPTIIARLSGAKEKHVKSPELWLPKLCGGGRFLLVVSHQKTPHQQIGGALSIQIEQPPHEIDRNAMKKRGWRGPTGLEFPSEPPPCSKPFPQPGPPPPPLTDPPYVSADEAMGFIRTPTSPMPMLLWCPGCGERHIDAGEFATKPHHTHACQSCGMVWRPALVPTVGVQFLPGFKNP